VQEDEKIFIDLNDYFRGNFFSFNVTPAISGAGGETVAKLIENKAISI
jgi:hypothetical protein